MVSVEISPLIQKYVLQWQNQQSQYLAAIQASPKSKQFSSYYLNVSKGKILLLAWHYDADKFDHIDHTGGTKVDDWYMSIRIHEPEHTSNAAADESKRTCLKSTAPHLKVNSAGDSLFTELSMRLLASFLPSTKRSIDVMETRQKDSDIIYRIN